MFFLRDMFILQFQKVQGKSILCIATIIFIEKDWITHLMHGCEGIKLLKNRYTGIGEETMEFIFIQHHNRNDLNEYLFRTEPVGLLI
jgi:hypothetical protein